MFCSAPLFSFKPRGSGDSTSQRFATSASTTQRMLANACVRTLILSCVCACVLLAGWLVLAGAEQKLLDEALKEGQQAKAQADEVSEQLNQARKGRRSCEAKVDIGVDWLVDRLR